MATKKENTDALEVETTSEAPVEVIEDGRGFAVEKTNNARIDLQKADANRKKLLKFYQEEEKVPMYLSPMYRPYFGNVMRVMINGISIYFKVDGTTQLIPKSFADEIVSRRIRIDNTLNKQQKLSSIGDNYETSPGELKLF